MGNLLSALIGIPLAIAIITSPVWLFILWRRRGRERWASFGDAYREARTENMTPAQLDAYNNDIGFTGRHFKALAVVGLIILVIMVPYLSLPVLALFCARAYNLARQQKRDLSDEPSSSVRSEGSGSTLGLNR